MVEKDEEETSMVGIRFGTVLFAISLRREIMSFILWKRSVCVDLYMREHDIEAVSRQSGLNEEQIRTHIHIKATLSSHKAFRIMSSFHFLSALVPIMNLLKFSLAKLF